MNGVILSFVVGQCIRLLSTDPWQAPTYRVEKVGKYSYYVSKIMTAEDWVEEHGTVVFKDQNDYEGVPCAEGGTK